MTKNCLLKLFKHYKFRHEAALFTPEWRRTPQGFPEGLPSRQLQSISQLITKNYSLPAKSASLS